MKLVDANGLNEYLLWVKKDRVNPPEFTMEQGEIIRDAIVKAGLLEDVTRKMLPEMSARMSARTDPVEAWFTLLLSIWVMGFQMGREFESRGIDLALQKTL